MTWSEIRNWSWAGLAAGVIGLAAAFPAAPGWAVALAVAVFLSLGPGATLRAVVRLSPALTALVVPAFGLSVMLLATTAMATFAFWHPRLALVAAAGAVVALSGIRLLWAAAHRRAEVAA